MKYILMVWMIGNWSFAPFVVEFNSLENCQNAGKIFVEESGRKIKAKNTFSGKEEFYPNADFVCVEK